MEEDSNEEDPMELLIRKHKKEKKELQNRIQSLKKSATKGDKKKKKEVQEEITKLENELSKKQEEEIKTLTDKSNVVGEDDLIKSVENLGIMSDKPVVKITKAQKRRDKKAAEQKEREKRILEQEIANKTGLRNVETKKIKEELKKRGLMMYDIKADGNCLYNAVDHQLKVKTNFYYGVQQLRLETSNHLRQNRSEYMPFLSNANTGDMMTEDDFEDYCDKIANTTNWGGQVELRALSHVVRKPITVIQADRPPLIMGEEYSENNESLIITYHRHIYQLGEHYNSVQPFTEEDS